ncbi:Pol polyprotein [Plakobranchus ocellatus]|uniref:Pol polyprotein n=1 Tax=Plakobranchus ocellatus TaxID=259542 RepID=A0AAV4AX51_9GAST|nr:Pol polyprotein [Plakobranchus ocellatus]
MPFGLKNAAQTFQRLMGSVLQWLSCAFVYLDEILVASLTEQQHLQDLRLVCSRLQDSRLVIKLENCLFGQRSLDFLGHQVSQYGSIPLPSKVKAITDSPKPSKVKGLQEFLGMVNFYHKFIPHTASLLLPLHCALQKSHSQKVLSWTADMDMAFAYCKEALAEATMLSHPKHGAHISLTTDASDQEIGGVLEQTSRWPEVIPLSGISSTDCAKALIRNWISRFGVPLDVTSDRETQFTSTLWGEIANQLGVQLHRTTAYHPQFNGLVERLHRTLKAALKARLQGPNWADELPWILLGLRTAPKEDIGSSAAELVYRTPLTVPGDKTFRIGDREEFISIDRLKPAHVDLTSPVPVAQPPRRGRLPLQPAQSEPQEPPEPEDTSSRPQARSTCSRRAVRLPPRFQ